jgi:hypothetical protein
MPNVKDWESAIGRVYRTRDGGKMRIVGMSDSPIDWEIFRADYLDGTPGAHYDIAGNVERHRGLDLMELELSTNQHGVK